MKLFFGTISSLSVRFRWLILALIVLLLVLGAVAANQLNQELLPPIEVPQTIILAQVSGMDSDQVLNVLTNRIEEEVSQVEDIINVESQTTGAFGAVITAYNDFGMDQQELQDGIRAAIDNVWLPLRRIEAPEGEDPQAFAVRLLADMDAAPLIYLSETDSNFFFELSPQVWESLSSETISNVVAYLAAREEATAAESSALERLVNKEVVPQLRAIDPVANVTIAGGQALPGEAGAEEAQPAVEEVPVSLLLRLSPEVWSIAQSKVSGLGELNAETAASLAEAAPEIPETAPALPESWQINHFSNASDLLEVRTLTTSVGDLFNNFYEDGRIVGALGQTDDLTPETVTQLLAIEPTLVEYLEAEQLVAMSPDVFAVLPEEFIADLDGFTRDALAAAALAQSITGEDAEREPVDLPSTWQIQQPGLITFSFADIPLATFSVFTTGDIADDVVTEAPNETGESTEETTAETPAQENPFADAPEGPALPPIFGIIGTALGAELNTADDLLQVEIGADVAGGTAATLGAADVINFLVTPPEGTEGALPVQLNPSLLVGALSPEAVTYLIENDPNFLPSLNAAVFEYFSAAVLDIPQVSPPLADAWDVLAQQPQFSDQPLNNAGDLLAIGDGNAAQVLNLINNNVPEQFEGYEVRLFNSLTPGVIRYFVQEQPDFYEQLDTVVLLEFNADVLSTLSEDVVAGLDAETAETVAAIASGEQSTAFETLQERYTTNLPPADPDAPALNDQWQFLEPAYGIELNSADDFFRFPEGYLYPDAAALINSIFGSPQGTNFAPVLLGNLPIEAVEYILNRDASVLSGLSAQALREFSDEALALLPAALQERAAEGGEVFEAEDTITRTNGQTSLFVTVFKDREANTVSTFAEVEDLLQDIDEANPDIEIGVVFEQSSFIEESISGVAREGGLGAVFAIIIIIVFLSSGQWGRSGRQLVGALMVVLFGVLFVALLASGLEAANNNWGQAFAQADTVYRVLLIGGLLTGVVVLLWPGKLPFPAWRATIVIGVSIPLSVLISLILMRWFSPWMNGIIAPLAEDSDLFAFILRLFPEQLTLNIMTLSGLTVAIGRVVDDSIVVLENIFRQVQDGGDKRAAVLKGVRDVSAAIFTATLIAMVVFLPLGLTGGIIGAFFLPFGLAVTYALAGSFFVAITIVPVLAYLLIDPRQMPDEGDMWLSEYYKPVLRWALSRRSIIPGVMGTRGLVVVLAFASMFFGFFLFSQRPFAFLPNFGEPQVAVNVELPQGTNIIETNELVVQLEDYLLNTVGDEQLVALQTNVGGGGQNFETLLGGGGVTENVANVTIGLDVNESELDEWTQTIRTEAQRIFGEENVTVSSASVAEGGFGGLALIVSGPADVLTEIDPLIIETMNSIDGITNVSSNLSAAAESDDPGSRTIIRVNGQSALSYTGELETDNTIGVTQEAILAIESLPNLPEGVTVSQGFQSELQTEGFQSLFVAMGIGFVILTVILVATFGSLVYWLALVMSIFVAPVGAAIALTLTDRVLGISALIGLLMLLGLVITNAVVLIDRVRANLTERNMSMNEALIEAGGRRLRPILMTTLTTLIALVPLAVGLSEGAIIASELGTVVIGGIISSTLLTLVVVPVMYSLLTPVHNALSFGRGTSAKPAQQASMD
ncbi:MAG: hypothetical protein OHK0046_27070 [Anaerolineae bacterium]